MPSAASVDSTVRPASSSPVVVEAPSNIMA